jgi:MFS family permease
MIRQDAAPRGRRAQPSTRTAGRLDPTKHWFTTDVALVLVSASAWGFAFSTFYLLPRFLTQELGAGPADIGLVVGLLGVSTVLFTLATAGWMERFSRRRAMTLGALAMSVAAFGFTAVHSLGPLIEALRVLQGVSYALVVTAFGTLIAELVPHERLSHALGVGGSSMLVMNAIAPAVGEPLAAAVGWRVVFVSAGVMALVAVALTTRIREPIRQVHPGARGGLLEVLRQPLAHQYALILVLTGAGFGTVFAFQGPHALALGRARAGGFFVAYAVAAIFVRVGFGHLADRLGRHRVALAAVLIYAAVVLAMADLRPGALEVYGAIFGLSHGVFYPAINALAIGAARPSERARITAIFTGSFSLGLWLGPTVLGSIAERDGYPLVFVLASAGILVAAILLLRSPELRAAGLPPGRMRTPEIEEEVSAPGFG